MLIANGATATSGARVDAGRAPAAVGEGVVWCCDVLAALWDCKLCVLSVVGRSEVMMSWKRPLVGLPLFLVLAGCPKEEPAETMAEASTESTETEGSTNTVQNPDGEATPVRIKPSMPSMPRPKNLELTAASDASFALRLLDVMPDEGNVVVGPSSISLALGLLGAGADAETDAMMRKGLGIDASIPWHAANKARLDHWSQADAGYTLAVANRIYASQGLNVKQPYLDVTAMDYGAPLERVNFASDDARKNINGWVNTQTRDMIPELLKPGAIDGSTSSVLVNAVYLNAPWQKAFEPKQTSEQPFTLADGSTVDVPLMFRTGDDIQVGSHAGGTVASIPYAGGELQMLLFLPEKTEGLAALESSLAETGLDPWLSSLTKEKTRLYLPRFKVRKQVDLKETLGGLGLGSIFGEADFSGISDGGLTVDKVIHEAVIDVTEEGTEAAAATAVVMTRSMSAAPMPRMFRADRPFLYAVYDPATASILFLGRYAQPE